MNELEALTAAEPKRDRYGRPMVTPRNGGKPKPFTRPTTIADTLDDRHNLELWMQRQVLKGSIARPDLYALAATTDPDTITSWFTGLYRDHGVGIATGPESGIFVLDVDDYEAYRDLERAHEPLPDTLTNLTGSGGMHFLFRYPTDGRTVRNNAGTRLGAGLDVRGDGGQIVAPPTVHPNGKRYEWDAGQGDDIVDAPEWLLELVCDPPPTPARGVR